ncbi:hypothetical protein AB0I45_08435 [Brevibacterium sp. NPDC049920]|uniref:Uncharacterized protein n=1 Tax=Brevibacterium pityocampae TaxID=506594 RepID=A0ABP8JSV3_9MICO|nr:hypothetical protein [uncultured Brevibacterium sp.]
MAVNDEGATYFLIEVRREAGENSWTAEAVGSHHAHHDGAGIELFYGSTFGCDTPGEALEQLAADDLTEEAIAQIERTA